MDKPKIKLEIWHWIVLTLVLFFGGSFLYVAFIWEDDNKGSLLQSNTVNNKPVDFQAVLKRKTKESQVQEKKKSTLDVKRFKDQLKNRPKIKTKKDRKIDSLKREIELRDLKITEVQKKYSDLLAKAQQPKRKLAHRPKQKMKTVSSKPKPSDKIVFKNYIGPEDAVTQLDAEEKKNSSPAVASIKVVLKKKQEIYQQSFIFFSVLRDAKMGKIVIKKRSRIEGVCSISRTRVYVNFQKIYTTDNREIAIKGSAYSLDYSPGIASSIKTNQNTLKRLAQKSAGLADIFDPSETASKVLGKEADRPIELYTVLRKGMMVFAKIEKDESQ